MISRDAIAGVVLAGGRSSRMGGADKAMMEIGGVSLLQRAVERVAPQVQTLAINSNTLETFWQTPVITDEIEAWPGPLAGILAGLHWAATQGATHLASVPCDTPFFPEDLVHRLTAAGGAGITLAASCNRLHPVVGLWPVSLAADLRAFLQTGSSRAVMAFVERHPHHVVDFPVTEGEPDPFFNVNTPQDLAAAMGMEQHFKP